MRYNGSDQEVERDGLISLFQWYDEITSEKRINIPVIQVFITKTRTGTL